MTRIYNKHTILSYLETIINQKIIFTNGCFDLLHPGHLYYLNQAKALGDILIVGLNSDDSVNRLKGSNRPINDQDFRAKMLVGLKPVDAVVIFNEDTPNHMISIVKPAIHVKGGDYNIKTLPEYDTVIANGGDVKCLSFVEGYSSTMIIEKLKNT